MNKTLLNILSLICAIGVYGQSVVTTYAGNGTQGFVNGDTAMARFRSPFGICMDKNNNLYVADGGNNCIRKISASGSVTTLAGTGVAGFADGAAASAQFNDPTGVCVDDSGNVYVSDFQNHRIRKISYTGSVSTIAGNGTAGYTDGVGAAAQFNYPRGICRDRKGSLYVGDSWNHRIRKIMANGTTTTYAGGGSAMGVSSVGALVNASDTAARFYTPAGVSVDKIGNVYVADAYNHRIRKIDTNRVVTTIAGSGATGVGNGGYANGALSTASLNTPTELHSDTTGNRIYIGDTFNNRVRYLTSGTLSLLAGKGTAGYLNGIDTSAQFNYARGVVANSNGSKVYVVDFNNHSIRKIAAGVTTMVGDHAIPERSFHLFPNPVNDKLYLQGPTPGDYSVEMRDVSGKKCMNYTLILPSYVSIASTPPGVYILMITGQKDVWFEKVVIY